MLRSDTVPILFLLVLLYHAPVLFLPLLHPLSLPCTTYHQLSELKCYSNQKQKCYADKACKFDICVAEPLLGHWILLLLIQADVSSITPSKETWKKVNMPISCCFIELGSHPHHAVPNNTQEHLPPK